MFKQFQTLLLLLSLAYCADADAWGRDGHRVVGWLAVQQLDAKAEAALEQVIGKLSKRAVDAACNWPDRIRDLDEYAHTRPFHYVNLPRWTDQYNRQRDCRDGACATEATKRFASQLADDRLPVEQRRKAFNWVCHLLGDLHQPLHAGYADDRGGNQVDVVLKGRSLNLHQLWDTRLIRAYRPRWSRYGKQLLGKSRGELESRWSPEEVDHWTEESNRLVAELVYPGKPEISSAYISRVMPVIDQRLILAGQRLARLLNALLGEGELVLDRTDHGNPSSGRYP